MPHATWRSIGREQIDLVSEEHLLSLPAITQPIPVVESANGLGCAGTGENGAEFVERIGRRPASEKREWRRRSAQTKVGVLPTLRLALDVATRPPAADQFQLAVQGGEFVA